jgi:hypothetical protein
MPLAAPPEVFAAPTAAPQSVGAVFAPGFAPSTAPVTPAPAAAAPVAIGAVFTPPPTAGVRASILLTPIGNPSDGDAFLIGETIYYFRSDAGPTEIQIESTESATMDNAEAFITASDPLVTASHDGPYLVLTARDTGPAGNSIVFVGGDALYAESGTLTGGSGPASPISAFVAPTAAPVTPAVIPR